MGQLLCLPFEGDCEPLGLLFGFVSPDRSQFSRQEVELTMQLAQELSQTLRMLARREAFDTHPINRQKPPELTIVADPKRAKAS